MSGVMSAGRRRRWVGYRLRFLGENGCNRSFAGVRSSAGIAAEAPGGVYLGKIGQTSPITRLSGGAEVLPCRALPMG
jgi:hypothetical protein